MHETKVGGGTLFSQAGWIDPDPSGTWRSNRRRQRAGGHEASISPAAEIVSAPLGLIGKTWLLNPPRVMNFAAGVGIDEAIIQFEAAEAEGHAASGWWPLRQTPRPAPLLIEEVCGITIQYGPWDGGVYAVIDNVILSHPDGGVAVFPELSVARGVAFARVWEIAEQTMTTGTA